MKQKWTLMKQKCLWYNLEITRYCRLIIHANNPKTSDFNELRSWVTVLRLSLSSVTLRRRDVSSLTTVTFSKESRAARLPPFLISGKSFDCSSVLQLKSRQSRSTKASYGTVSIVRSFVCLFRCSAWSAEQTLWTAKRPEDKLVSFSHYCRDE